MKKLHFQPVKGKGPEITEAIIAEEEITSCKKEFFALHLVIEELAVNIADYAYPDGGDGYLDVLIDKTPETITITFKDGGTPFNPLERKMPDIDLPLEERGIGGLGIFLTVKKMDEVKYDYRNNENVLTIMKKISNE
jgi:anti-sigma regulatory factor (Ser/Thr protein kinase)